MIIQHSFYKDNRTAINWYNWTKIVNIPITNNSCNQMVILIHIDWSFYDIWHQSFSNLTHCGLVTPYGNINLCQHRLRLWLVAWWHQAITWTNVDFSEVMAFIWSHHLKRFQSVQQHLKLYFKFVSRSLRGQWVNNILQGVSPSFSPYFPVPHIAWQVMWM